MEEKGNAGHVLFLHFKSLQFFSVKLSISFLPSYPILFCQAKYFCQGRPRPPRPPPLGTPMLAVAGWRAPSRPIRTTYAAKMAVKSIYTSPNALLRGGKPNIFFCICHSNKYLRIF